MARKLSRRSFLKRAALSGLAVSGRKSWPALADKTVLAQDLIQFVNIFVGTEGHGHTYPGATVPFGMVQLKP